MSGGVDSTFLLHTAVEMGADVLPVIVRSAFVFPGETEEAVRFCRSEGVEPVVVDVDVFADDELRGNPADRCYLCKRAVFGAIIAEAGKRGYPVVADGTNASDDPSDRPGTRALDEMGVYSPLRDAGLTKAQIRRLARTGRVCTWNRISNSCRATRVRTGTVITEDLLDRISDAESALGDLGFSGFRVRTDGVDARIQFIASQRSDAVRREEEVARAVAPFFRNVVIDEVTRDGRGDAQAPARIRRLG